MKKVFKTLSKIVLSIIILLLVIITFIYFKYNEPLPEGTSGSEAEVLATKMLAAVKHEQYKKTRYLSWTFPGDHHYVWDKDQQNVIVSWDNIIVDLNLKNPKSSNVKLNNAKITSNETTNYIEKALAFFNNDSFWLVAPHKIFDEGVTRSIVSLKNNEQGLLVTYASGGTTPGDSYLWILDENYRPKGYKMWVSIIPIGGLYASWDDWSIAKSGIPLSNSHKIFFMEIPIKNVKAWN